MMSMILIALATTAAPAPAATAPSAPASTATAPSPTTRYCVVDTFTGSRIATRVCRTRSQWLDRGFDPTAPK